MISLSSASAHLSFVTLKGYPILFAFVSLRGPLALFAFYCAISDGGLGQLQFYGNKGGYAVPIGVGTEPRADTNVRLYYDHLEVGRAVRLQYSERIFDVADKTELDGADLVLRIATAANLRLAIILLHVLRRGAKVP